MQGAAYNKNCPIGATLRVLGGKWKIIILFSLYDGTKRFNELRKIMPAVTQRMLTNQLRELEEDNIIARKIYAQVPPKVEYSLTPIGISLKPVLEELKKWGLGYVKEMQLSDSV